MKKKLTKTPTISNAELIENWLKTNSPTRLAIGQLTPKEDQVGYGFGRPRPKRKSTNID
jgi:hypothetical protein